MKSNRRALWCLMACLVCAPASADKYDDVVAAPRPEADTARDVMRTPAQVLRWIGFEEGMSVLDMGAGGGYYSELIAPLVGAEGTVYVQNPAVIYERFGDEGVTTRLADDRLPNAVRYDKELNELDLEPGSLDLAFAHLIWHDFHWMYDEVDPIVAELKDALKSGGRVVIIDHAAPEGTGARHATPREGSIHRIDEQYVIDQFTSAGFELIEQSDMLRVPSDDRTKAFFSEELRGKPTDRFALIFRKP